MPAKVTNVIGEPTVREGTNLQLICEATGKPKPNITWTKVLENGSKTGVPHQEAFLNLTNINRNDSGLFDCTAYNGFGNPDSQAVNVDVTCKYTVYIIMLHIMHFPIYIQ